MGLFLPRRYQNKPRQWGPLSAVRSAVLRNAERLGIDPAAIVGLWSAWETAGTTVFNIMQPATSLQFAYGNPTWVPGGVHLRDNGNGVTNDILSASSINVLKNGQSTTLLLRLSSDVEGYNYRTMWRGGSTLVNSQININDASIRTRIADSQSHGFMGTLDVDFPANKIVQTGFVAD